MPNTTLSDSLETIMTMSRVFWYIELCLQLQGVIVSSLFLLSLARIRSMHPNLLLIFVSFIICCLIMSTIRFYYIVQLLRNIPEIVRIMAIPRRLRNGVAYAGGLHLLLLACERLLATKRSKTYEKETHISLFIFAIITAWIIAMFVMFLKQDSKEIAAIASTSFIMFYGIAIAVMAYVRRTNLRLWRQNRCALKFSHVYQVRENVETSTSLFRCFVFIFAQTLFGFIAFVTATVFRFAYPNLLLYKIFNFLYDISTALAPTSIPLLLTLYDGKINATFKRLFNKVSHRKERSCNLIGLEGNQLQVDAKQETETYFRQLKDAWA